ncbi:hypothetical protein BDZ94DRAFT_1269179 [Collybia nuda]|uniref:F-box domain-containing protein n=1 Tax=Collybia nuda TaxID=64659 RepID=A0A9P5XWI4_9AGAR|nr:hypothetical protein BDZ94DRAFT_1269179 [Collybia nuda]
MINIDKLPTRMAALGGLFDTLPVEILGEIFKHCLPSEIKDFFIPSMKEAPLLLCRICVRWRWVAMNMPVLWSSFSAQPSRAQDAPPYVPLMKFFLGLSRPSPLSFNIYAANPEQRNLVKQSFPLFLYEVHRWYDVTLHFNDTLCEQYLEAPLGDDSMLESLCFNTSNCTDTQARRIPATLKKFPRLRRLKIGRIPTASLHEIPWSQLTDVRINTALPLEECVNILSECSNMVTGNFSHITPPHGTIKTHKIILLALTRLELCSICDVGRILAHLTCSVLTYLSVNHMICTWDTARDLEAFYDFLIRSTCQLETFRLLDEGITEPNVIQYLSAPGMQKLKSLELHGLGISVKALTMFKYDAGDKTPPFMPLLETMQFDVEEVPDNLFSDVVASRFNSNVITETTPTKRPVSLKYIHARFRRRCRETSRNIFNSDVLRSEHVSDEKRFEEFMRQGLRVAIRFGG